MSKGKEKFNVTQGMTLLLLKKLSLPVEIKKCLKIELKNWKVLKVGNGKNQIRVKFLFSSATQIFNNR